MTIDSAGNVGIGESSPTAIFEVACPSGFTNIKAGTTAVGQLGCMQTAEEGSGVSFFVASDDCFATYGGRLPTSQEWYIAMSNFALTNETDDWEWVSDRLNLSGIGDGFGVVGSGSVTAIGFDVPGGTVSQAYRCFIPR